MKIGGWKTRSMFQRYKIQNKRDQQEAVAALERCRRDERESLKSAVLPSEPSAELGAATQGKPMGAVN